MKMETFQKQQRLEKGKAIESQIYANVIRF